MTYNKDVHKSNVLSDSLGGNHTSYGAHIANLILLEMGQHWAAFKVQGAGLFHSAKVQLSKLLIH